jgi:hypothetical protein
MANDKEDTGIRVICWPWKFASIDEIINLVTSQATVRMRQVWEKEGLVRASRIACTPLITRGGG